MLAQILIACLSVAAQQTWTVDDDGPADFPTIQAAVDAATDGDVIFVEPGTYAAFTTNEALSVVGHVAAEPVIVTGLSQLQGAPRFTLAGLSFERVIVQNVPGPCVIDRCSMGVAVDAAYPLYFAQCAAIELSRSQVVAKDDSGSPALWAESCALVIVDSVVRGGSGSSSGGCGEPGGDGVVLTGCHVVVAGSSLRGGDNGPPSIFSSCSYPAGKAVHVWPAPTQSTVVLRGLPTDLVEGAIHYTQFFYYIEDCIDMSGGTLIFSGVTLTSGYLINGTQVLFPPEDEPFLEVGGSDVPGSTRRIHLYGKPGWPALLVGSLSNMPLPVGKLDDVLWPNAGALLFALSVTTTGYDPPLTIPVPLPAATGFAGVELHVQAVFLDLHSQLAPGKYLATNPSNIVLRF